MAKPRRAPVVEENEEVASPDRKKILKIGGILVAIAVVVIIIVILASGGGPNSVAVGNIDRDADGITFSIMATKNTGDYTGDVDIEIYYEDVEEPVYEGKASINDGDGTHQVDYVDFVWGNGDYFIYAKGNGHEDFGILRIESVVEEIVPEFTGENSDLDMMYPDFKVDVTIGYIFGSNRTVPRGEDPQDYRFIGTITTPDDESINVDSLDYSSNLLKITRSIDHETAGTYSISGTVVNNFCRPDSPFREVHIIDHDSFTFDARPFAVLGNDISVNLVNDSVDVTFDASESWDDSSIEEYKWFITGEGLDVEEVTSGPSLTYSFAKTGDFVVSISLTDDSEQTSIQNADVASLIVTVQ